eukprot:CAMPEP_0180257092 /NCGR_PEP_ID=MMETSP0987-20121128/41643_1 /TAXON_ID=697907 /ORGANISM="non described non described, Strain CCMP2293" /LENGTH=801 /DNA_ID=CAMNT_0022226391 /DNA_START=87 /DNA_END=2489 /DNA_ORIENTATION=+
MSSDPTGPGIMLRTRQRKGKAQIFVVCIICVMVHARVAGASIVGEAIASSVVAPVLAVLRERGGYNQSSGPTPFLRASTDEQLVPYVNSCHVLLPNGEPDCANIAGMCASKEGNCAYVGMIENVAISGLVLALLLSIVAISSCTLCCFSSRDPPSDSGGEDRQGGVSPVARRSLVAAVMVGGVVVLSALGFLCVAGVLSDVLVLLDGVQQVASLPRNLQASSQAYLAALEERSAAFSLERDALLLSGGLQALQGAREEVGARAAETRGALLYLQVLVEGCVNGTVHCAALPRDPLTPPPGLNGCVFSPDGDATHALGIAPDLSNGGASPACRDPLSGAPVPCPCCLACWKVSETLRRAADALPGEGDLGALNASFSPDEAPGAARHEVAKYAEPIRLVLRVAGNVSSGIEGGVLDVSGASSGVLIVVVLVFAPLWLAAVCLSRHLCSRHLLARARLGKRGKREGQGLDAERPGDELDRGLMGDAVGWPSAAKEPPPLPWWGGWGTPNLCGAAAFPAWWVALASCVLAFVVAPALSALSLLVLPFTDLCDILPSSPASPLAPLLSILDASLLPSSLPSRVFHSCVLVPRGGSLWVAAGVDASDVDAKFALRNASESLPRAVVQRALDPASYAPLFAEALDLVSAWHAAPGAFGIAECVPGAFPGCGEDEIAYRGDVALRVGGVQRATEGLAAAVLALEEASRAVEGNVTRMGECADAATDDMRRLVWDAGGCDAVHAAYEAVRSPLCQGLASDLSGAWAALFLALAAYEAVRSPLCQGLASDLSGAWAALFLALAAYEAVRS